MNNTLYQLATEVRAEQQTGANTNERVGYLLQQIVIVLGKSLTGDNMKVEATAQGMALVFTVEGESEPLRFDIPVVTDTKAGIITPYIISTLRTSLTTLIATETSVRETAVAELSGALSALAGALESETDERITAIQTLAAAIEEEVAQRGADIGELSETLLARIVGTEDNIDALAEWISELETMLGTLEASQERVDETLINVNRLLGHDTAYRNIAAMVQDLTANGKTSILVSGVVVVFKTESGWKTKQYTGTEQAHLTDEEYWDDFGGSAVGNIFNVTKAVPIATGGYYVLSDASDPQRSATHVAAAKNMSSLGLIISFEIGKGVWKTYQYTGSAVDAENWNNPDNWTDFGSLAAGSETFIVIDKLVPRAAGENPYDLNTAIQALLQYQQDHGVVYAKEGLVISYRIGEEEMETKQFQGNPLDIHVAALWKDFGGGGKLESKDAPEAGGKDAFSTGAAYEYIPAALGVNTEDPGTVKLSLFNAGGEVIGDEIMFPVGSGGSGGGGGTTMMAKFRNKPLYGKVGGAFVVEAAIMSLTKMDDISAENMIDKVEFRDRTTKKVLATFTPRKLSSPDLDTFDFSFDISRLFTTAGETNFQVVITDEGGRTLTQTLLVVAVDVTCVSRQTLNYTKDTTLTVGGPAKTFPMYAFPNFGGGEGITATVEMLIDGEWTLLETVTVGNGNTRQLTVNPTTLGLRHGAYAVRIHGFDAAANVHGNTLYTSIMVLETDPESEDYDKPIVAARWSDDKEGIREILETVTIDVAAYQRSTSTPAVDVALTNTTSATSSVIASLQLPRHLHRTISHRLMGYGQGNVLAFVASSGEVSQPEPCEFTIQGSLISIEETAGAAYKIDLSGRSNADADKSISTITGDGETIELHVYGANYSSNGFVATPQGRMALRIAENVTAECTDRPFNGTSIETNGMALSFTVQVRNVADREAVIMQCMGERMGFVLNGEKLVFAMSGSLTDGKTTAVVPYVNNVDTRFDIVFEPVRNINGSTIGIVKVYRNGDEAGAVEYRPGNLPTHDSFIAFDGTDADLYLFNITRWNTYYDFIQAHNNYLIGLPDTSEMIAEYEKNNVMASSSAEGIVSMRPSMQSFLDAGIMVCAITKNPDTEDVAVSYPNYLEALDGDKKTPQVVDWYCYFPDRPWQDCHIVATEQTNQGTTSSKRPIKNKKSKYKKAQSVNLLYTREQIAAMFPGDETVVAKYDKCAAMAAKKKIQIREGGNFTNIICIKVDFSDSCGAHNGAMMQMMNELQLALGRNYTTPAQQFHTGEYPIMTSIDSVPCALFRTDNSMSAADAVNPGNAYMHAKANFNADKGDAGFFGFEGVSGYNAACVNYGDFKELVAPRGTDFSAFKDSILADTGSLVAGKLYMLSEFCGPQTAFIENDGSGTMQQVSAVEGAVPSDKTLAQILSDDVADYDMDKVYLSTDGFYVQYKGGLWIETTGTMTHDAATDKWSVTGRVLNPVECYEYLKYDALDWGQGVNSVDDMVRPNSDGLPVWLEYYESRYPDDDDLVALYESGKKVPYQLYRWLAFNQQCNHNLTEDAAYNAQTNEDGTPKFYNGEGASTTITVGGDTVPGTKANRLRKWQQELHLYANPYSTLCYVVASDYKATVDQRSKNKMLTFYLETNGNVRAYCNHWYDGDCVDGSDNDCGLTIPWNMDGRTSHLYQGWDGVLFNQCYNAESEGGIWTDAGGDNRITLHSVAGEMREAKGADSIKIFSPEGCYKYWITQRLERWAKVVSSYDGERKYINTYKAGDNYLYALHGLRLEDLPDYQRKRFKFCDGRYEVGSIFENDLAMRAMGTVRVGITAADDGFFSLGKDRADAFIDSCQLSRGESVVLDGGTAGEGGDMTYVYGADNISRLDLSQCSPKNSAFNIETCKMLRELILGSPSYRPAYETDILSSLSLPEMPFLESLDVRNTRIASITMQHSPRLQTLLADGSRLTIFEPSESAPLVTASLPASMTDIRFVNLPGLTYPNGGLTYASLENIAVVKVEGCPHINAMTLLADIIAAQTSTAKLQQVRVVNQSLGGDGQVLLAVVALNLKGRDDAGQSTALPVIRGTYTLTAILDEEETDSIISGIEGITLFIGIGAYIRLINEVNGETYSGEADADIPEITLENIDDYLLEYNGETHDEYLSRLVEYDTQTLI